MVLIIVTGQVLSKNGRIFVNGVEVSTQALGKMLIWGHCLLYYW
jgi:hypothetical protein